MADRFKETAENLNVVSDVQGNLNTDPDAPCGVCDHPHQGHGTRYTAGHGNHTWTAPRGTPFRTHTELHAAAEAERARDWPAPRIVPHPAGGVTMTSQTQENPAPEREPGGVSDQPTAIAGLGFTEFGERTDRPIGIIRRILNATRSTT